MVRFLDEKLMPSQLHGRNTWALMCSGPELPRLQWMITTPHCSDCFCYSWTIPSSFVQKSSHLRPNQSQLECNGWLEIAPKPYQRPLKLKSWNWSRQHQQIGRGPHWIYTLVKARAIINQVKSYMAKVSNVLEGFTSAYLDDLASRPDICEGQTCLCSSL